MSDRKIAIDTLVNKLIAVESDIEHKERSIQRAQDSIDQSRKTIDLWKADAQNLRAVLAVLGVTDVDAKIQMAAPDFSNVAKEISRGALS